MGLLLKFSAIVDAVNEKIGVVCNWLVLLACIVSGGNAMIRYAYDIELQRLARSPVVHVRRSS